MLRQTKTRFPTYGRKNRLRTMDPLYLSLLVGEVPQKRDFSSSLRPLKPEMAARFPKSSIPSEVALWNFRRMTDIGIGSLGMLLCLLLIPFIFLGNRFGNPGALFYRQKRIGKNGNPFPILKFRTMIANAEPNGPQWAQKNDRRAPAFGRILRRSRLDEFPQFYNILKGDMSLIGPRPERPIFVKELSSRFPPYDARHSVKPGLTGLAQVMLNYGNCYTDSLKKLQFDLYYIRHRSFLLDLNILLRTLLSVLLLRGQ